MYVNIRANLRLVNLTKASAQTCFFPSALDPGGYANRWAPLGTNGELS